MRTVKETIKYVAFDGTEFASRNEVIDYERVAKRQKQVVELASSAFENADEFVKELVDGIRMMSPDAQKAFLNGLKFVAIDIADRKRKK